MPRSSVMTWAPVVILAMVFDMAREMNELCEKLVAHLKKENNL